MLEEDATAQETMIWLFATSATNIDSDSEYACGVHTGLAIALAVITDGIPEHVTTVDPNALARRGYDIYSEYVDQHLIGYLEEKYAMPCIEVEG